jgi:peptidoglycan/xylan/chitin deacetylase (PgdA/CDA1 family)
LQSLEGLTAPLIAPVRTMKMSLVSVANLARSMKGHGSYQRAMAQVFCRRAFRVTPSTPLISFTFDDFPRSALLVGGGILQSFGLRATYYASFGLMGTQAPTGLQFQQEDLKLLLQQGHELGCHTFGHCHAWNTHPRLFEEAIVENRRTLAELAPGAIFKTLSYPIGVPRVRTKQIASKYFACCRCGGQTANIGNTDLNYLSAYFLEQTRDDAEAVKAIIDYNRLARGWLVFATHDISPDPTPWGCKPAFFENIVRYAVASGAHILPVFDAYEELRTGTSSVIST